LSAAGAASRFALALSVFCVTAPVIASAQDAPVCAAPAEATGLEHAPMRLRERIAQGLPIKIVAIGSSTGGVEALLALVEHLTPNCAPTVHVPADIVVTTDPLQSTAVVTFAVTAMAVDGSAAAVSCSPPSGSAFPIGTTTVSCVGTDAYGNVGTASFTVTVHGIVQLIAIDISQIQSFTLAKPGITISFDVKLQAILATARAGNITAACSELQAFINEVNAQTQPPASKPLTPAQASQLLAAANQIKTVLGCP